MARKDKFEAREERIDATDYRAFFDSQCLRVWHLNGKQLTVRIASVTALTTELYNGSAREVKKQPKLALETRGGRALSLPLLLNKTNAKTIAGLYGNNPHKWAGKLITLYPSETDVGGETKDCIRVRNQIPSEQSGRARPSEPAPAREPERAVAPPAEFEADERDEPEHEPDYDAEPPPGALSTDNREVDNDIPF